MFVAVIGYNDSHIEKFNELLTLHQFYFHYERPCLHSVASMATAINCNGDSVECIHSLLDEQTDVYRLCRCADIVILLVENCSKIRTIRHLVQSIRKINSHAVILATGILLLTVIQEAGQEQQKIKIGQYIQADVLIPSVHYENIVIQIINAIKSESSLSGINGIIYRDVSSYRITEQSQGRMLNKTGYVNWSLVNNIGREIQINTSWSCPFHCTHCFYPNMMGRFRVYDVDEILRQLDYVAYHTNTKLVCFFDRYLDVPNHRFRYLLKQMIERRYPFKWYSFIHGDQLDDQTIKDMENSNCLGVAISLDSADPGILSIMRKRIDLANLSIINAKLQARGMLTHALFIVGTPGETLSSYYHTIDYINQSFKPDFCLGRPWFCHYNAPIIQQNDKYEITGHYNNWCHNTMDYATARNLCGQQHKDFTSTTFSKLNLTQIFQLYSAGMSLSKIKEINSIM